MATIKIICRARPNKDGLHPLQLRITKNKRSVRINLGKTIKASDWDDQKRVIKSSHPNSKRLNNFLQSKLIEANQHLIDLEVKSPDYSLEMIKDLLVKKTNPTTVFAQCDLFFENIKLAKKFNRYSGEMAAVNHLKRFRGQKDMNFEDMTVNFLKKFKAYLIGDVGVSERSAVNYLITLRSIFNCAISSGVVDQVHYPFGRGKISCKRPDSEKIGLDDWEVKLIEDIKLDPKSFQHHARNVWLFSFYFAGMRASDVLRLTWDRLKGDRLYYTMGKNHKSDSVKISTKAKVIIDQYENRKVAPHNLVFPDLANVEDFKDRAEVQRKLKYRIRKLNKALEDIREQLGLQKSLTMHIARHTFGNIAGDRIPIQRLQQLYRHSSILTTINYQKAFLYKGTDDALDEVLDF